MQVLEKLSVPYKSTLVWIPGNHGILGSEKVDKLAKEETNKVPVDQTTGIPYAVA